jgi:hypothetical protein
MGDPPWGERRLAEEGVHFEGGAVGVPGSGHQQQRLEEHTTQRSIFILFYFMPDDNKPVIWPIWDVDSLSI